MGWVIATGVLLVLFLKTARTNLAAWKLNREAHAIMRRILLDRKRALMDREACMEYSERLENLLRDAGKSWEVLQLKKAMLNMIESNHHRVSKEIRALELGEYGDDLERARERSDAAKDSHE